MGEGSSMDAGAAGATAGTGAEAGAGAGTGATADAGTGAPTGAGAGTGASAEPSATATPRPQDAAKVPTTTRAATSGTATSGTGKSGPGKSGPGKKAGRRPVGAGTRELILETARASFAELGYDRTTLRGIASRADVDVALVSHYFGGKRQLFALAAELPFDPDTVVPRLLDGPRESVGRRLLELVLNLLDDPAARSRMTALIRAAAAEEAAAEQIRERITSQVLFPIAGGLGTDEPEMRAALTGSQVVGLVMARHIVGLPPLADRTREELMAAVAPVLQHYLTGDLHTRSPLTD